MKKIRLDVIGITYSQSQSGAYLLVLEDPLGKKHLPIIIGPTEAQSIAIAIEDIKPPRPLTHDLFCSLASTFGIEITEVLIVKINEGVFYSLLVCEKEGEKFNIDSRTSDAIALAIRFKCPIFATPQVMQNARDIEQPEDKPTDENPIPEKPVTEENHSESLSGFSLEELELLLQEAIDNEDYEKAGAIRDEIRKRK